MKFWPTLLLLVCSGLAWGQNTRPLDHNDIARWRKIENRQLSNNGEWVAYTLVTATEGDAVTCLWNATTNATQHFDRASGGRFSADNQHLVFTIKPQLDTLKAQRRRKVKDEDLPKDTLAVLNLASGRLEKTDRVKNFVLPEKWNGLVLAQLEPFKVEKDTSKTQKPTDKKARKAKKEDKDNGSRLLVINLISGKRDTVGFVTSFALAEKASVVLVATSGYGDTLLFGANPSFSQAGVYRYDLQNNVWTPLCQLKKAKFQQLSLNEQGAMAAFLVDSDTTKVRTRPWELWLWKTGQVPALPITNQQSTFLPNAKAAPGQPFQYGLSEHMPLVFSEKGDKLYFGMAPPPVLTDTTLLTEEIVNVEVWNYKDPRLYTHMKNKLEADKKRAYPVLYRIDEKRFVPLGSPELPEWRFQPQRDAEVALAFTEEPYAQMLTWVGTANKDFYSVDLKTGVKKLVQSNLRCAPQLSPAANYILWWADDLSNWFATNTLNGPMVDLTGSIKIAFYDETTDVPDAPDPYGMAGWYENDAAVLLYDRYDLWRFDPSGKQKPERLTAGRESRTRHRYVKLDPEERFIRTDKPLLLHLFNDSTKAESYVWFDVKTGKKTVWQDGPYAFSRPVQKARDAEALMFTRENFRTFPDLLYVANSKTATVTRVSNANPHQSEYRWGDIALYDWTSLSGKQLQGLLVKPDGFDPTKQYPMIVYFYEKLTDGLNTHRAPDFHRSSINFTFYTSRGYIVFAPDIPYKTGYPGESCYDAVMSGVASLLDEGYIDRKRVGVQGHSWGGYQTAYLITKTNLFACAESGAPVVNMTSAYGGIRWESGLSRAFQYERQQSRIGGTLWEYPMRYLENSPLFSLDKVQTPVLILHNDKDGAVPWYQGIEMFTALRRLGKPSWLLNYNDEPHWPVKLQNRVDFQTRMAQYFDHYLLGAPMPKWMESGVPPLEKGILQGLQPAEGN